MLQIDVSCPRPEENIAYDDALLDLVDSEQDLPYLRFWETNDLFVVLGHGNKINEEVNEAACIQDHIPLIRRPSGGGTILQGPGVLNYSLVFPLSYHESLRSITSTNTYILSELETALKVLDASISYKGITDIVLGDKKIVGNAQRRKRNAVLFHGCILTSLDLALISKYLKHPSSEPNYRKARSHEDFLAHLAFSHDRIKEALSQHWRASHLEGMLDLNDSVRQKVDAIYTQKEWNYKF
jgi:lipoate-protein ligase A